MKRFLSIILAASLFIAPFNFNLCFAEDNSKNAAETSVVARAEKFVKDSWAAVKEAVTKYPAEVYGTAGVMMTVVLATRLMKLCCSAKQVVTETEETFTPNNEEADSRQVVQEPQVEEEESSSESD